MCFARRQQHRIGPRRLAQSRIHIQYRPVPAVRSLKHADAGAACEQSAGWGTKDSACGVASVRGRTLLAADSVQVQVRRGGPSRESQFRSICRRVGNGPRLSTAAGSSPTHRNRRSPNMTAPLGSTCVSPSGSGYAGARGDVCPVVQHRHRTRGRSGPHQRTKARREPRIRAPLKADRSPSRSASRSEREARTRRD